MGMTCQLNLKRQSLHDGLYKAWWIRPYQGHTNSMTQAILYRVYHDQLPLRPLNYYFVCILPTEGLKNQTNLGAEYMHG